MSYWIGYFLILIAGAAMPMGLLRLAHKLGPPGKKRDLVINLSLSFLFLFLTLMMIELYFKLFFAQPDAFVFTLSAQNWQDRYWQPINSLGYRDREWTEEDIRGKLKIMVVGDSLAAGLGIENHKDRFSDKLNELLGKEAVVFNVASPGWHTGREIEAMVEYPYRPDILILAYFVNDIEGAAFDQGVERQKLAIYQTPLLLDPLIQNSYAFNFVYWRLVRLGRLDGQAGYWQWLSDIFETPEIWWAHQQELQTIYAGAQAEKISLIVVVFPNISTLAESQRITRPVLDFFRERGTPTVDVTELIKDRNPRDLMVSPVDAHPNEVVNQLVAEYLYQLIHHCEQGVCPEAKQR